MKQTAVEWMFEQLWETPKDKLDWYKIYMQACIIEKQQIIESANYGYEYPAKKTNESFEIYYQETYEENEKTD